MRRLLAIIFLLTTSTTFANEMLDDLGLAWGETQKTLTEKNFNLTKCSTIKKITSCEVIHSAEGVAFGALYILFFDQSAGLQKIQMPIRYIEEDATGKEGKSLYSELKKYLTKRYDKPKSYEYVGRKLYGGYDEFYQCLKYDGCGSWASFWEMEDGDYTYISLIGVSEDAGYLVLFNESKQWQVIVENIE